MAQDFVLSQTYAFVGKLFLPESLRAQCLGACRPISEALPVMVACGATPHPGQKAPFFARLKLIHEKKKFFSVSQYLAKLMFEFNPAPENQKNGMRALLR